MIANSINTNLGALVALQNLTATQEDLTTTQNRISTGLKIATAKDNGAIWAIAQSQRAASTSLDSVKDSLSRVSSTVDVALAAGQSVSDLLTQMQQKALAASDTSLDTASRAKLNQDFVSLRDQITKAITNADFNGANLIKGGAVDLAALANADGSSRLTVKAQNLSLGGGIITVAATGTIGTATLATTMIATIKTSLDNVNTALASLGTSSKALNTHLTFIGKLKDSLDAGVGNLVDADLAKESARLQALQSKQQLGIQALSIANQSPQSLMQLFK